MRFCTSPASLGKPRHLADVATCLDTAWVIGRPPPPAPHGTSPFFGGRKVRILGSSESNRELVEGLLAAVFSAQIDFPRIQGMMSLPAFLTLCHAVMLCPLLQTIELYDKGCQTDLAGTAAHGGGEVEEDGGAVGAQPTSSAKKTSDKRRNHLR